MIQKRNGLIPSQRPPSTVPLMLYKGWGALALTRPLADTLQRPKLFPCTLQTELFSPQLVIEMANVNRVRSSLILYIPCKANQTFAAF